MTNWRTTLTALIGAVLLLINYYFNNIVPIELAMPIVTLAVALFAKDSGITGIGDKATDNVKLDATKVDPTKKDN